MNSLNFGLDLNQIQIQIHLESYYYAYIHTSNSKNSSATMAKEIWKWKQVDDGLKRYAQSKNK